MGININKNLVPLKAHYFLFNAGTAPVVPFMPVFARQLGFSPTVVGTVYTILPITGMLAKPLFGAIADRFQRQKLLFLLFQILTAIAFFCIMFIPTIPQTSPVEFHCNGGEADMKYCPAGGDSIHSCTIESIISSNDNSSLNCHLTCKMESWMWDVVCKNWHSEKYCASDRQGDLEFTARINSLEPQVEKNCLFFMVNKGIFPDGSESSLYCPHTNETGKYFNASCEAICDNPSVNELITESKIPNSEVTGLYQFWMLFLFLVLSWAGMAVVVSVGDAICFEMLGDDHHLYGNQRLWGAVGWGIFSLIAGLLVDAFSKGQTTKDYSVVFYMMLVLITCDMFMSKKLKYNQTKLSTNILKDVGAIFTSARIVVFFLWCIGVGLCTALVWNFLFWHLEDLAKLQENCSVMGSMKTLEGLVMGIQCFGGELPFFFLSGWILKKIGHINAMSLVLLGFGVRFLFYSILTDPWWVLPIEFLNGITFGIFYSTMASYASIVAPSGTEATIQGLVGAVFEGVGVSTGSFVGGYIMEKHGGSQTFRLFGVGALILFLCHVTIQMILDKTSRGRARYTTPSDAITMLEDQDPVDYLR